jgi:outer membrane protein assembly factor BamD (BamD/ComL family)
LARALRDSNPKEAANIYQLIKKEFPETNIAEQADRGLDSISPKS